MTKPKDCPCGSGKEYTACCEPIINGTPAPTAEALMRSRYSAYVVGNIDYIQTSLAPEKHKSFDPEGAQQWSDSATWLGLTVHDTKDGGPDDETGEVEFTAVFEQSGGRNEHHEYAQFRREGEHWLYVDGNIVGATVRRETPKIGRNEPCPCGSGKKYKKCCMG